MRLRSGWKCCWEIVKLDDTIKSSCTLNKLNWTQKNALLHWLTLLFCWCWVKHLVQYCVYSFTLYLERSSAFRNTTLPRSPYSLYGFIGQWLIVMGIYHLFISHQQRSHYPDPERLLEHHKTFRYWSLDHSWESMKNCFMTQNYSFSFPNPNVRFRAHRWGLFSLQKCLASLHAETPESLELQWTSVGTEVHVNCVTLFLLLFTVCVQQNQQPVFTNHVTRSVHMQAVCKDM